MASRPPIAKRRTFPHRRHCAPIRARRMTALGRSGATMWDGAGPVLGHAAQALLGLDPLRHRAARHMRDPGQAEQGLVEVDVALDQARQHQQPAQVADLGAFRRQRSGRGDAGDPPACQQQIGTAPLGQQAVAEQQGHVISRTRRAATTR